MMRQRPSRPSNSRPPTDERGRAITDVLALGTRMERAHADLAERIQNVKDDFPPARPKAPKRKMPAD